MPNITAVEIPLKPAVAEGNENGARLNLPWLPCTNTIVRARAETTPVSKIMNPNATRAVN